MIDTNTGELLACVTYPGYDTNRLANTMDSDYYSYLNQNLSNPLYNHATQQRTAPGSTFKMVTATRGPGGGCNYHDLNHPGPWHLRECQQSSAMLGLSQDARCHQCFPGDPGFL